MDHSVLIHSVFRHSKLKDEQIESTLGHSANTNERRCQFVQYTKGRHWIRLRIGLIRGDTPSAIKSKATMPTIILMMDTSVFFQTSSRFLVGNYHYDTS